MIDGRALAHTLKTHLLRLTQDFQNEKGVTPGLAVVRIGEDVPSEIYVRRKGQEARSLGYHFEEHHLPASISFADVEKRIAALNASPQIHGIILQLPVPPHLCAMSLLACIDPLKDVDGLHPLNAGKLFQGIKGGFIPCTPQGCLMLIEHALPSLKGLNAGVVGRSLLVGRPMGMLLLEKGCTLWMAHSQTRNLQELCQSADILVVATGRPGLIPGQWIKPGAVVIDVGINRLSSGDIVGDVDFTSAQKRTALITPVPGGVGPMTVMCLLKNTLKAAYLHAHHPWPFE